MGESLIIGGERAVRFHRHLRAYDLRFRQEDGVLFNLREIGNPLLRCIVKVFIHSSHVEIARAALRKFNIAHGLYRHSYEVVEALAFRFEKGLYGDIGGDVVS